MKKNNIIKPTGLKGNQKLERIKELMGQPINESVSNSVIELTKKGPDGKIYGIVRENHKYYIKTVSNNKTYGLVAEDFQYIGGLQNKEKEVYPTYAKAIKKLNLKFLSLNESYGGPRINVFEDDNLQKENFAVGFGFVEEDILEEIENNDGSGVKTDTKTSGDNLDGDFDEKAKKMPGDGGAEDTGKHKTGKKGHDEHIIGEDVELTEDEKLIDAMIEGLDPVGQEDDDINNDGKVDDEDEYLKNRRLKISKAMNIEETEEKMESFIKSLSPEQAKSLIEALTKKSNLSESDLEKGKFTKWCKANGFDGPSISCAKKAYNTSDSAKKMAVFYMNTVKPEGKDADALSESLKKKV